MKKPYPTSAESSNGMAHGREAIERLAAIVNASDDAIIGKDLDRKITSWNLGVERLSTPQN